MKGSGLGIFLLNWNLCLKSLEIIIIRLNIDYETYVKLPISSFWSTIVDLFSSWLSFVIYGLLCSSDGDFGIILNFVPLLLKTGVDGKLFGSIDKYWPLLRTKF